jgi:hypothetical protein
MRRVGRSSSKRARATSSSSASKAHADEVAALELQIDPKDSNAPPPSIVPNVYPTLSVPCFRGDDRASQDGVDDCS